MHLDINFVSYIKWLVNFYGFKVYFFAY